ncbi:GGDEF domain-containing protein [Longispora sp. NPDC051575]|uniref:GGDEF domain-containing protein n=1 Tax=Longispora sp. NPDC051575 TaxID=3154943 RepID=UPI00342B5576
MEKIESPPTVTEIGKLIRDGRSTAAAELAGRGAALATDPVDRVRMSVIQLAALINLGRIDECPPVLDRVHAALAGCDEPALRGEFHALAANVALHQGSLGRCMTHLAQGTRALEQARVPDFQASVAWLDLAVTYSCAGFPQLAVETQQRCHEVVLAAGLDPVDFAHPEIRVRYAVSLDHQGDTDGCARVLRDLVRTLGPDTVSAFETRYLGYAAARLAALGDPPATDPRALLLVDLEPYEECVELRRLGEACLAIGRGEPDTALRLLEDATDAYCMLGGAEVPRLRSLAHTARGDHAAALAAERVVACKLARSTGRMVNMFLEGITARLDHDELRGSVTRYADEAHTDALTGLPNRRHLERYVADLTGHGTYGTIGVADLDGFKAVNTVHGHLAGDVVLQQVAAILTRTLRGGDFLARYGGDEFVLVLPDTRLGEADEVCDRLARAVAAHDWAGVVPGTPVTVTIGLAELDSRTDLTRAFEVADLAMLHAKSG